MVTYWMAMAKTTNWLKDIESEVRGRATDSVGRSHLVVDYYRIRRLIAYPLPIKDLVIPDFPVTGLPVYPWAIWMLWAYEERVGALGYAAEWFEDEQMRDLAERDLVALAGWSGYRQFDKPDLSLGHAARLMWLALRDWSWLSDDVRAAIHGAMERIISDTLPLAAAHFGPYSSVDDILALDRPGAALHNIPVIGTIGAALAAHELQHLAAAELNGYLTRVTVGLLEWRRRGFAEGVAYDGYVMDFLVHWLETLDADSRRELMDHERFEDFFDESLHLAVPGDVVAVAELGDVEPRHMPFHLSAHAKFLALRSNPRAEWLLRRAPVGALRTDALAALRAVDQSLLSEGEAPQAGFGDAHYAVTLRSGWKADDLAVVASMTTSPMGHLHCDAGSVVIGSRSQWLICDPGYQQYMQRSEREFTLGATAHNSPVINGQHQKVKPAQRAFTHTDEGDGLLCMTLDMSSAHDTGDGAIRSVKRTIWLCNRDWVVVADSISGDSIEKIGYTWHGHPAASWWVEGTVAHVHLDGATLYVSSPGLALDTTMVNRLRGSRGQLSLCAEVARPHPVTWWIFSLNVPRLHTASNDRSQLTVDGRQLICR